MLISLISMRAYSLKNNPAVYAYLGFVAVLYLGSLALPSGHTVPNALVFKEPAETSLSLVKDVVALAATWATGLFAGAAAITVKGKEWSRGWSAADSVIVVAVLACGVSVYYGCYRAYMAMLDMAEAAAFNPKANDIGAAFVIQYYSALAGTLLLGLVFARMLDRRISG